MGKEVRERIGYELGREVRTWDDMYTERSLLPGTRTGGVLLVHELCTPLRPESRNNPPQFQHKPDDRVRERCASNII